MKILYLFGPNLGALGTREPETYGTQTLDQIMAAVTERGRDMEHDVSWRQSDHEGELVGWLHGARAEEVDAIVVNPGALTHYSYALRDAIEGQRTPGDRVHMTNIHAREEFRRISVVADVCRASIIGFGAGGYHLALEGCRGSPSEARRIGPRDRGAGGRRHARHAADERPVSDGLHGSNARRSCRRRRACSSRMVGTRSNRVTRSPTSSG